MMLPLLLASILAADFKEHIIATDLKGGYQVVAADLNHDGKPDLIALGTQMSELVWYENPTWERHVIASGLTGMINLAIQDDTIVLAYGFSMVYANSKGIVAVLKPNGDPRQPWTLTEIDRLPTSHRLRWATIGGEKVVINAPLIGPNAIAPEYRDHVPLVFYRPNQWKREQIANDNEGVQHGITIDHDSILTASFSGLDLYRFLKDKWTRTEISKIGTSDVAVGHTGKQRFLATIEPWHGNKIAVYTEHRGQWRHEVIDDSLLDAHTILTADLNNNGRDQIIAGMRGKPYQVLIYSRQDNESRRWTRKILDTGSMAAAACTAIDLNADHRIDLACIGSATTNLKWYENLGN